MKIFLENNFICLVTFWKCYFPPPPPQNPPPHNRKTTKTPPPTPPQQQQKNQRSKRESKKSKSQTNFITKISNENENESVTGSWCDSSVRSARCDSRFVVLWSRVRGFAVWLAGAIGAVQVGSSAIWCERVREWWRDNLADGVTISLLSLSLSSCVVRKWRDDLDDQWLGSTRVGLNDRSGEIVLLRCDLLAPTSAIFLLFLSLSLLFSKAGNHLKWKWKRKSFSVVLALIFGQLEMLFSLTKFEVTTKHPIFWEIISRISLKSKQTEPKFLNWVSSNDGLIAWPKNNILVASCSWSWTFANLHWILQLH